MVQFDILIPSFKKIIRASELPNDWAFEFTNPDQLVVVTIRNNDQAARLADQQMIGNKLNLAAPSKADRLSLRAMPLSMQEEIYSSAILHAASQAGRKVSKQDIKVDALKLPNNV